MAQSNTRIQLENWLKTIDVNGSTLDIGGAQHNIKGRTKSWNVDDYKVLDLEQPHQGEKPDIEWDIQSLDNWKFLKPDMTWDLNKAGLIPKKYYQAFDVVFCIEVSEYFYDPWCAISMIGSFLKKGGLLYISFHFIYPEHLPKGEDCLRYTPSGVKKLLEARNFEILENVPRKAKVNFAEAWSIEGMRGWKDFDTKIIGNLIKARKL